MWPLKVDELKTLKPYDFWAWEALKAQTQDCSNITSPQKWHSAIFKISAEKIFPAWQQSSCTFLHNFGVWNLQKSYGKTFTIHSISTGNLFFQAWKFFSAKIWKTSECHLWANVTLRESYVWASRASPAQKMQGLRLDSFKNFSRATIFVFWVT